MKSENIFWLNGFLEVKFKKGEYIEMNNGDARSVEQRACILAIEVRLNGKEFYFEISKWDMNVSKW